MREFDLNELTREAREIDRPSPERADGVYRALTGKLGLPSTEGAPEAASTPPSLPPGAGAVGTAGAAAKGSLSAKIAITVGAGLTAVGLAVGGAQLADDNPSTERQRDSAQKPAVSVVSSDVAAPEGADEVADETNPTSGANSPDEVPAEENTEEATGPVEPSGPGKPSAPTGRSSAKKQQPKAGDEKDRLAEEVSLIRRAKLSLNGGNPARALQLLDVYDQRFPSGNLGSEAKATRVLALCALSRAGEARDVAGQIDADSPLGKRMKIGCKKK